MNKTLLFSSLLLCLACAKTKSPAIQLPSPNAIPVNTPSEVSRFIVLKLTYTDCKLEGAREFTLSKPATINDSIPFRFDYKEPSDLGYFKLFFKPSGDTLFYGDIFWLGTGKMFFPHQFDSARTFPTFPNGFVKPSESRFQKIIPGFQHDGGFVDYYQIWGTIGKLQILDSYLKGNKKIAVYAYTPSVGGFNPEKAHWIIYLFK